MPIAHRCDPSLALTVVVWSGPVTADQWLENLRERERDPDFSATWKDLVDERASAPDSSFTPDAIEGVVEYLRQGPMAAGRTAAIVKSGNLEKLKFYRLVAEQAQITAEIFSDLPSACAWLQVDHARVEALLAEIRKTLGRREGTG